MEYWQKKWNNSETGCHLKAIQPTVSLGNSSKCLKLRSAQVVLHQVKIGRSELNNTITNTINKKELQDKLCDSCNVPEDTEHYSLQCPRYESQRRTMFLAIKSILNDNNLSRNFLGKDLQFLSENKNLSKSTREILAHNISSKQDMHLKLSSNVICKMSNTLQKKKLFCLRSNCFFIVLYCSQTMKQWGAN